MQGYGHTYLIKISAALAVLEFRVLKIVFNHSHVLKWEDQRG